MCVFFGEATRGVMCRDRDVCTSLRSTFLLCRLRRFPRLLLFTAASRFLLPVCRLAAAFPFKIGHYGKNVRWDGVRSGYSPFSH